MLVFISHTGLCEILVDRVVFPCQYHSTNAPHSSSSICCFYQKDKRANPLSLAKGKCSFEKTVALDRPVVFKLSSHAPLSRHKTCSRTVPLGTANINAYFHDTGLPGCFVGSQQVWRLQTCQPAQQHRFGQLKFRSCYFSNSKRLADTGQALFILEQGNSVLIYAL